MPHPDHQVLDGRTLDPGDRQPVTVNLDRELIQCVDARRGDMSREKYIEQVLLAGMQRLTPHLPDNWRAERAAEPAARRPLT